MSDQDQAGQPQAGQPATQPAQDEKVDKRTANYKAGYADGLADARRSHRQPLFEAAKSLVSRLRGSPLDELDGMIRDLEREYGEQLRDSDRDLILAIARRHQTSGSARDQAIHDLARPRRPRPLPEDRAATVYDTVA